ncbi:MAG: peptidoglycan DD-metalloendopeptidase family protein [Flavobacteriales bacterium]|nr:peptidoglycan DD-metalloendopeptidase family protein [Flavobacteriales bacterium]
MRLNIFGEKFTLKTVLPIGADLEPGDFVKIDLSQSNPELAKKTAKSYDELNNYVQKTIKSTGAKCAVGGYGEKRAIYKRSAHFKDGEESRSIHLGVDFWMPAQTPVQAPIPGTVHSFADNDTHGDYGPTIILKHYFGNITLYSLYGHLSKESLEGLEVGTVLRCGETFAKLGERHENVDWPPHLHFPLCIG